jgi:hypothetical protein
VHLIPFPKQVPDLAFASWLQAKMKLQFWYVVSVGSSAAIVDLHPNLPFSWIQPRAKAAAMGSHYR